MPYTRWPGLNRADDGFADSLRDVDEIAPRIDRRLDILVVEDHEVTRRALELSLGHLGHLVFAAGTLRGARLMLRNFQIDVVVCDVTLPDGDASELLHAWPSETRRVPTVAMSGWPDANLGDRCRRAGFEAFFAKPLHVDALDRAIRRLAR